MTILLSSVMLIEEIVKLVRTCVPVRHYYAIQRLFEYLGTLVGLNWVYRVLRHQKCEMSDRIDRGYHLSFPLLFLYIYDTYLTYPSLIHSIVE